MAKKQTVNKQILKVEVDGVPTELAVLRPDHKQNQQAQQVHGKAFREAVEAKLILRARIDSVMREQKLWDDTKSTRLMELTARLAENEKKLATGGIKLSEARDLAIEMRHDRTDLQNLLVPRSLLDQNTAEASAEQAQLNYLVSVCTVDNKTGKQFFKNVDDYLEHASEDYANEAAKALANMLYGIDPTFEKNLPENKFLAKFKLVDSKLRFINDKGHLVDEGNRLVNENGQLVNEQGQLVDANGNLLTETGDYIITDAKPFLDENGQAIEELVAVGDGV